MKDQPNAYLLAFFTALLAGIFSLYGGYILANFESENEIFVKQNAYRVKAYRDFLESINKERAPFVCQLLNIGTLAEKIATDYEIQSFENKIEALLKDFNTQEAYWQLNSDFNILRLYGTKHTRQYCSDILSLISFRAHEINWNNHSESTKEHYKMWQKAQDEGIAYGWEEKITGEERLMVIMTGRLFQELICHLRENIVR